jgi:hypothetical protein
VSTNGSNPELNRDIACRQYNRRIHPILGFLRTCKQIHQEASSVFYGENIFRFTTEEGWTTLAFFLTTIGPRNASFVRKISVTIPWIAEYDSSLSKNYRDKLGNRGFKDIKFLESPTKKWYNWFHSRGTAIYRVLSYFEVMGALTQIELVLSDHQTVQFTSKLTEDEIARYTQGIDDQKWAPAKLSADDSFRWGFWAALSRLIRDTKTKKTKSATVIWLNNRGDDGTARSEEDFIHIFEQANMFGWEIKKMDLQSYNSNLHFNCK